MALLALAALAAAGCATEQDTINRVQPNALSKKIFNDGDEWYAHAMIIDTDYGAPVFVGDSDSIERITWEIQEDYLLARRAHEHVPGIEGTSISGEGSEDRRIVAMYAISSHFDIKRDYNPVTGEEQNVISENTVDRPWHEREYFRVDWSKNHVPDTMFSVTGTMGGVSLEPVNYFVQNQGSGQDGDAHPWAPVWERDEDGNIEYFDLVSKYIANPSSVTAMGPSGPVSVPACALIFTSYEDCRQSEISVRQAFMKVKDRDYQPFVYTPDRMERAGYFMTQRDFYDRNEGLIRDRRLTLTSRHNLWQKSYKRDTAGDVLRCNPGDSPEAIDSVCGGNGSICDRVYGLTREVDHGACTIPYRERETRPIAFHVSENFPETHLVDAIDLSADWDVAFREVVASLRVTECMEYDGRSREDCAAEYSLQSVGEMFAMCHNPVIEGDNPACGPAGTLARIGDLRYHLLGYVNEPHKNAPLGYGPSFTDPLTGEIINATAFVYGAPLESYAGYARDLIALMNGDLSAEQVQDSAAYSAWLSDPRTLDRGSDTEAERHVIRLDGSDAAASNAAMNFDWVRERTRPILGDMPKAESFRELMAQIDTVRAAVGQVGEDMALAQKGRANFQKLVTDELKQLAVTDEMRLRAGLLPGEEMPDDLLAEFSPLGRRGIASLRAVENLRRKLQAGGTHVEGAEFVDYGLLGLVRQIDRAVNEGDGTVEWYGVTYNVGTREAGIDYDMVREMVRHPMYHAVTIHELGHTLGLRHNFAGSYDSLNYKDRYWELRNDGNMQPRAWDPITDAEIEGRIMEFQYSTVMDYGNNFIVTNAEGLGKYDHAAIKLGYGDLVEAFTDVPTANIDAVGLIANRVNSGAFGMLDLRAGATARFVPYTEMPAMVGGIDAINAREDVPFTSIVSKPLFGGDPIAAFAPSGQPLVPYHYCGDEFADFQAHCLRYDSGADYYETIQSVIDSYWEYYPLSHFQNNKLRFNYDSVPLRTYSRFFAKLESANRIYGRYRAILGSIPGFGGDELFERVDGLGAYTVGVTAAYNLLRKIIGTPEPGTYEETSLADGTPVFIAGQGGGGLFPIANRFDVDTFEGRYLRTGFDFGPDFAWIYLDRSGYFHDKTLAMQVLTYSDAEFIGEDTEVDSRQFATSFYTTFPDSMTVFMGGLASHDWQAYAPRVINNELVYPSPEQVRKRGGGMGGSVMNPNFGFSLELVGMVYGMSYIPRSFDQDYVNKSRIFVEGGAESLDLAIDEERIIRFTDERSGITYMAASYPEVIGGETVEAGIGARMLAYAHQLKEAERNAELADWVDNLNIARQLTWQLGFGNSGDSY